MTGLGPASVDAPGTAEFVDAGEVDLHAVVAGPDDGEPVVLLHGFPECWYAWHDLIGPLAAAGYRVVAPDQRGYNRSDKPNPVSAYRVDALAGDVSGLLDAIGADDAHIVGHDWGALVAWWLALHDPDRVRSLSALNVPHPTVLRRALVTDPRQLLRSWYGVVFQLPWVPEALARRDDWRVAVASMANTSRPGAFSAAASRAPSGRCSTGTGRRSGPTPARAAAGSPPRPWCCGVPKTRSSGGGWRRKASRTATAAGSWCGTTPPTGSTTNTRGGWSTNSPGSSRSRGSRDRGVFDPGATVRRAPRSNPPGRRLRYAESR